jgi:hypothetical protein
MTKARLNLSLLIWTVAILFLLAIGTSLTHSYQVRRFAREQVDRADQAELEGNKQETIDSLRRSLAFAPGKNSVRIRYALALADSAHSPRESAGRLCKRSARSCLSTRSDSTSSLPPPI